MTFLCSRHILTAHRSFRNIFACNNINVKGFHATIFRSLDKDTAAELLRTSKCGLAQLQTLDKSLRIGNDQKKNISKEESRIIFSGAIRQALGLMDEQFIQRLYISSKEAESNEINRRNMVTSAALLLPEADKRRLYSFLFRVWDSDEDGYLSLEEFIRFYIYIRTIDPISYSTLASHEALKASYSHDTLRALAEQAFVVSNADRDKGISEAQFLSALGDSEDGGLLRLDDGFFERVRDPFRPGQLLAPFSTSQRNFLKLHGSPLAFFAGDNIPLRFVRADGVGLDCFYLILSGTLDASLDKARWTLKRWEFFNEESLLTGKAARHRLTQAKAQAQTDCLLLRLPTGDFRQARESILARSVISIQQTSYGRRAWSGRRAHTR